MWQNFREAPKAYQSYCQTYFWLYIHSTYTYTLYSNQLKLTHQILKHGLLMCKQMICDGFPTKNNIFNYMNACLNTLSYTVYAHSCNISFNKLSDLYIHPYTKEIKEVLLADAGLLHSEEQRIHKELQHFFFPCTLSVGITTEAAQQLSPCTETGHIIGTEGKKKRQIQRKGNT